MKQKIYAMVMAAALLFSLTACGNAGKDAGQLSSSGRPPQDNSVRLENPVSLEGKKVETVQTLAEPFSTYSEFSKFETETVSVVRGVVTDVEYFARGKNAFTKMDLDISESVLGDFVKGDTISVYKWGGYIPLSVSNPDIQERFPEITDEELENTVVDMRIDGDPHPVAGQDIVVFLAAVNPENQMYSIVGGHYGQFTNDGTDQFTRHLEQTGSTDQTTGYALTGQPEIDRSQMTGTNRAFTFEQLKAETLEALSKS